MRERKPVTRRQFIKAASSGAAVTALGLAAASAGAETKKGRVRGMGTAANDKIVLGFIGVAGRGYGHLDWFGQHPDVEIGAICDVHQPHLDHAVAKTDGKAKGYHDFRKLLENKEVDAVVIATPPHWHALITLAALEAGKDVYCEKPMCRYPNEGRAMVEAAKRYKRVTQVGTQIHATENYHKCVDVVRSGTLGQITAVRNLCTMNDNSEGLGNPPDSDPPPGLDWDFWLGPAPKVPFNIGRFRDGMHRYFKDYVDSWLHELGPHIVDLPFWALELGQPKAVSASGGRFATTSIADVPDTLDVVWEYPTMNVTWTMMQANSFNFGVGEPGPGRRLGILFHGKQGTLIANYGLCQVLGEDGKVVEGQTYLVSVPPSPGHEREFLNAIKSREECSCSFEKHLPMHTALNLAHISLRLGRKLHWDAEKWEVTGDREATQQLTPPYRAPWKLPRI
ncbi:MAG TPA: Gfo/Idh/MocA family oxidoreductase [Chthonomonadaceae bacterium]|nr:Gfo/Idh/MocA family oxidoreductase [Chthonomonadaceae bacterium]